MSPQEINAPEILLGEIAAKFPGVENVRAAIAWIQENPSAYKRRMGEFGVVVEAMNNVLKGNSPVSFKYGDDLKALRDAGVRRIPSLSEVIKDFHFGNGDGFAGMLRTTLAEIGDQISTENWQWLVGVTEPNQIVSALLIEGFGRLIEREQGKPGTQELFVRAFEGTAWAIERARITRGEIGLRLIDDCVLWMIEVKEKFPPAIRKEIMESRRYGVVWGGSTSIGEDEGYQFEESPEALARRLGFADACPRVPGLLGLRDVNDLAKRYIRVNFWRRFIFEAVRKKPDLYRKLNMLVSRKEDIGIHSKDWLPKEAFDKIFPAATAPGFGLPRLLLTYLEKGFEPGNRTVDRNQRRLLRALQCLEAAIALSENPEELLVNFAKELYLKDYKDIRRGKIVGGIRPKDLLHYVLNRGNFEENGDLGYFQDLAELLKSKSRSLGASYEALSPEEKKDTGIIDISATIER